MRRKTILLLLTAGSLAAQTRRAVIVGIDQYHAVKTLPPHTVARVAVRGAATRTEWTDLGGAVNDASEMKALLIARFGFREKDIVFLTNEQATADRILSALQSQLVDRAAKAARGTGDIGLFYYAGHGSQIVNRKTNEADGLDETIVPADGRLGTPDIRDKELARIYRAAAEKGVRLTVIQDSCHSGSGARGLWNARGRIRELPRDGRYVEDPPDKDAGGQLLPAPEDEGVLVLSASQDEEPAHELTTDTGAHGLFSFALFHVLETSPPHERVDLLFQRVRAVMQSEGVKQEPVMAGAGRNGQSLLGQAADSANVVTAAVDRIEGGKLHLQAGNASGLYEGCELVRAPLISTPIRIRIAQASLNASLADVIEGPAAEIGEGDLFRLDRWKAPEYADLRVYVPPALPREAILAAVRTAREAASLAGATLVEDPTQTAPQAVLSRQGNAWLVEAGKIQIGLGPNIGPAALAQALRSMHAASLFPLLPPPNDLALPIGPGTRYESIVPENDRAGAQYVLYGRPASDSLSYAWVLPNLTEDQVRTSDPPLALPLRSEWFAADGDAARKLTEGAAGLARVRGWLTLPSPPATPTFPYRLALRDIASGKTVRSGDIADGQQFRMFLEAPEAPQPVERQWVYVFEIDREGRSTLLFPLASEGNVSNRLPLNETGAPAAFPLTTAAWDVKVQPPFGAETFLLLVSAEALPNPLVLDFDGAYKARGIGGNSALGRLLGGVGSGQRGLPAVPLNWFLERQTFRSVPRAR